MRSVSVVVVGQKMFSDTPAVTASLDRLMHHGHFIQIRGKSYRLHESGIAARERKAKTGPQQTNPT